MEDFAIETAIDGEDTTIITTSSTEFAKKVKDAIQNYDFSNRSMSVYLNNDSTSDELTTDLIDSLGKRAQYSLQNIQRINSIVESVINTDDIIGKVDETIESNINTDYKLKYDCVDKDLTDVKELINAFNDSIEIDSVIREAIPSTYRSGNYIMYLRHDNEYAIDVYPIGVAVISNYHVGHDPYVLIDINKLTAGLRKNYTKTKSKKPLFYNNIDEEIKATYPAEVYDAYKNKEQYAKLDIRYSYVLRVGNMGKPYGLTPIFKALKPSIMLDTFERADRVTSKANAKKIIVQVMNKEFAGEKFDRDCYDLQAYNHANLVGAFKNDTVLATLHPSVSEVKYVESQTKFTDKDTVNSYRNKVMSALGVSFLMESTGSVSNANISLDQLMKTINKIGEQLEHCFEKFYKQILIDNGYDPSLAPHITIIDSEQLEQDMKISLATFMYNILGASRESCFNTIGLSIKDEALKRKEEKENGYDEVFTPYATSYTTSGNETETGRPSDSKDETKQQYDKSYNKTNR